MGLSTRVDELPAEDLARIHADPDARGWVDGGGLLVNGRDAFAERRRYMREKQMGAAEQMGGCGSVDEKLVMAKQAQRVAGLIRVQKREG